MAELAHQVALGSAPLATVNRLAEIERLDALVDGPRAIVPPDVWARVLLDPARSFLSRPGKGFRGRLTVLAWTLAGGADGECPPELPGLIELIHAGSLIVDDIEDGAEFRRGAPALHRTHGVAVALNAGNWLYFAALQSLVWADLPRDKVDVMRKEAIEALLHCHHGQALDLSIRACELKQNEIGGIVATCTKLKTGALMRLAARLGARAATDDEDLIDAIGAFGEQLGIGLQMLDDIGCVVGSARRHKAIEDLRGSAPTWAWSILAETSDELTWARLQRDARRIHGEVAEPEALLDEMRERLEHVGMSRVNNHLSRALRRLRRAVGRHPAIKDVAAELQRLRRSYH